MGARCLTTTFRRGHPPLGASSARRCLLKALQILIVASVLTCLDVGVVSVERCDILATCVPSVRGLSNFTVIEFAGITKHAIVEKTNIVH